MTSAEAYALERRDGRSNKPAALCGYPDVYADEVDLFYLKRASFYPDGLTVKFSEDDSEAVKSKFWKFGWVVLSDGK